MKLQELSLAMDDQYNSLHQYTNETNESKQLCVVHEIEKLANSIIKVSVVLEHIKTEVPKGVQFCGGKMCIDKARITIEPQHNEIEAFVKNYLLKKQRPAMFFAPAIDIFDTIVINGIEVERDEFKI
ncbi:MAG: hypothetical protein K0S74_1710 [Chlamydiales bacterium]|jgi:hypothetical protein|nr:hypothetical protein [Chlamydiales bacterium]